MKFEVNSAISLASGAGALMRNSRLARRTTGFILCTSLYSEKGAGKLKFGFTLTLSGHPARWNSTPSF
jgi:hypothetical protein